MVKKVSDGVLCTCEECYTQIRIKEENLEGGLVEIACPVCGVVMSTRVEKKRKPKITSNKSYEYLELYNKGMSVDEIAKHLKVKSLTVRDNLLRLYSLGFIEEVDFITVRDSNREVIEKVIKEVGSQYLKPIKEVCPSYITYDEIALVVADWNKKLGIKEKLRSYEIQEMMGSRGVCYGTKEFFKLVKGREILSIDGVGYYHDGYQETLEQVEFGPNGVIVTEASYPYVCWYNR